MKQSPRLDLSAEGYEVISYYLFAYIAMHGGILYAKRFMEEYNVPRKKYYMARDHLKKLGLIRKGKGRSVRFSRGPFSF